MPSAFKYTPLDQGHIRLLRTADSDAHPLTGNIGTFPLDSSPEYYALSYFWGDGKKDNPINIEDEVLYVTPNLAAAIRRLWDMKEGDPTSDSGVRVEWIWIDQICINQGVGREVAAHLPEDERDRLEKAAKKDKEQQLPFMGAIYTKAIRTLIWLGRDGDECSPVWSLVDEIYNVFHKETPAAQFLTDIPFAIYSDEDHTKRGLPEWADHRWKILSKLFKEAWFTRVWIIQEAALSKADPVIIHRRQRYTWDRFGWVASWLRRNGYLRLPQMPNGIQNVDLISNIRRSREPWSLEALLVATSIKFHASWQHDKVYGLMGLAAETRDPQSIPAELRVNYDLKPEEVYEKASRFLLGQSKTLSVLTRASGVEDDINRVQRVEVFKGLSSWVPNWGEFEVEEKDVAKSLSWLEHSNATTAERLGFPVHFDASGGQTPVVAKRREASVLELRGQRVDNVCIAIRFNQADGPAEQDPRVLRLWNAVQKNSFWKDKPVGDRITAFIKATTADQYRLSGKNEEDLLQSGSAYLRQLLHGQDIVQPLETMAQGANPHLYIALCNNFCFNRSFLITAKGKLGIGPAGTQVDDGIAVLCGGGVPYVLRAQKDGYFSFVGESYVYGLMNGEAVQQAAEGESPQEIQLR